MEKILLTSPPIKQIIQSSETSYIKPIHSLESPLLQGSVPPRDAEIPTSSNNRYIGQEKAIGFPIAISIKKVLSGGQPGAPFPPVSYTHLDVYKRQHVSYESGWSPADESI